MEVLLGKHDQREECFVAQPERSQQTRDQPMRKLLHTYTHFLISECPLPTTVNCTIPRSWSYRTPVCEAACRTRGSRQSTRSAKRAAAVASIFLRGQRPSTQRGVISNHADMNAPRLPRWTLFAWPSLSVTLDIPSSVWGRAGLGKPVDQATTA